MSRSYRRPDPPPATREEPTNQARAYRCPACGGHVDEAARLCPYCRSPLATVRCGFCFHMNPPESLHCSGCGRELGLEPVTRSSGLECPRCRRPFDEFGTETALLRDCSRCGGQFVDHLLLKDLLEARQVYGLKVARRPANPLDQPIVYRSCPICQALMNRQNFGKKSGVIVDICARHGIWFDAGELPRVLDFVQSAGQLSPEQRDRTSDPRPKDLGEAVGDLHGVPLSPDLDFTAMTSLAEVVRELLATLRRLIRS